VAVADEDDVSARARLRVGTVLCGKYRLDAVLGVGGMATVYAATHVRNANRVAVKILHRELSVDLGQRRRFVREGYTANSVGHPGTVRVLDDDTSDDGSVFIVMDLLEGETLDARWQRSDHHLGVREVVMLVAELLDVLSVAHAKGIVHRDLKPENLFLARDGKVRVLDFGVARLREGSATQTKTGSLFGTPAFMAPEQALGRTSEVDARSDLWAVGATTFTLLAGRFVHLARTTEEMLVLSATQPAPSLASVVQGVPPILAEIVDRALAFDKMARWPNAQAMREAFLRADELIRSAEDTDDLEDEDDEKTRLALAPEMTLRGQTASTVWSGPQDCTLELPTLPAASTVAGVESQGEDRRARRGVRVIASAVGIIGIGTTVALAARPGTSGRPAPSAPQPPVAGVSATEGTLTTPAAPGRAPAIAPRDVGMQPVAQPTISAAPIAPIGTPHSVEVRKPLAPTTTVRLAPPIQLVQPEVAPLVAAPAKKRDPLAP
jgi:eukaryotic-like serine/threonine-protein kinase